MSMIRAIMVKLGLSGTTTNNFILDASANNGTMKLTRESGGDILTVDSSGRVRMPASGLAGFSATASALSIVGTGAMVAVTNYAAPLFNDGNYFNASTGRFTPQVAGYYQVNAAFGYGATQIVASSIGTQISVSGGTALYTVFGGSAVNAAHSRPSISTLIFLNGTTDYIQVNISQNSGATKTDAAGYFSAFLVKAA